MRPLTLCQFFQSDYNPRIAIAFLFYTTGKKVYDHQNHQLGQFISKDDLGAYEDHMKNDLIPMISLGLKESAYQTAYIEHYNNSPQPSLAIMRKDGKSLTLEDMQAIKTLLEGVIEARNKKMLPARMFSSRQETKTEKTKETSRPTHHYNTRSKCK